MIRLGTVKTDNSNEFIIRINKSSPYNYTLFAQDVERGDEQGIATPEVDENSYSEMWEKGKEFIERNGASIVKKEPEYDWL